MNREVATVVFQAQKKKINIDLEIPLSISANDLVVGLNDAYNLGIDTSDIKNCYLKAENPIVLLKGNKPLSEFGIRDGSLILFTE
ncbi:MAG: EsaB/YukD family protein [Peptoniphilaceae bacterium]|nr:EsaB/YukD family protein [Peptoniphilaceae bacterium]MDY3075934.1 EsaB/YukD family protein [Peptoniphilaceae bacterium]